MRSLVSRIGRATAGTLGCVLLTAMSGCEESQLAQSAAVVRDSAGIRIVLNERPAEDSSSFWTLSDGPSLVIGSSDGDGAESLFRVVGAVPVAGTAIAVIDGSSQEIRVFDATGTHIRTFGGSGEGPGRFRAISTVIAHDDSLLVFDRRMRSVTGFSLSKDDVGTRVIDAQGRSGLTLLGRLPNGNLVLHSGGSPIGVETLEGVIQTSEWLSLWDPTTGRLEDIVESPGMEMVTADGATLRIMSRPYGRQSFYCLAGDRIITSYSEHYEIRYHTGDGVLIAMARKAGKAQGVTEDAIRAYREQVRIYDGTGQSLVDLLPDATFPPTMPRHGEVVCDSRGNVWVSAYRLDETEPASWSVFDAEGQWITDVRTPASFRVTAIGSDYVLGISRDESDIEYVVRYGLRK